MKKIVALLLALTMLCSMAACGAKGESAEPSNTASSEAAEVQQPEQTTGEVNSAPAVQEEKHPHLRTHRKRPLAIRWQSR